LKLQTFFKGSRVRRTHIAFHLFRSGQFDPFIKSPDNKI